MDCAAQFFGLYGVDQLAIILVQTLDPSILPVSHTENVHLLRKGQRMRDVESVRTTADGDPSAIRYT